MVVRPTQSRGGVKGETSSLFLFPLRSPEAAPLVGFGATPQLFLVKPTPREKSTRRRQRSVPASNFAHPQMRPPTRFNCRAKWARPRSTKAILLTIFLQLHKNRLMPPNHRDMSLLSYLAFSISVCSACFMASVRMRSRLPESASRTALVPSAVDTPTHTVPTG